MATGTSLAAALRRCWCSYQAIAAAALQRSQGSTTSSSWRTSGTDACAPFFPPLALDRLEEGERQQDHRDVVVPAPVSRDLVVIEADLALGELEVLFDRPAQAAHRGHLRERDRRGCVTEVALELGPGIGADGAAGHQPALGPRRAMDLLDHAQAHEFVLAGTLLALRDAMPDPVADRQRPDDLIGRLGGQCVRPRPGPGARPALFT